MHLDALNGKQETNETLWYKTETMRLLTSALEQEGEEGTIKDETIASVILLAHVLVCACLHSNIPGVFRK